MNVWDETLAIIPLDSEVNLTTTYAVKIEEVALLAKIIGLHYTPADEEPIDAITNIPNLPLRYLYLLF